MIDCEKQLILVMTVVGRPSGADASRGVRQKLPVGLRQRRIRRVLPEAEGAQQLQAQVVRHAAHLPTVRQAYAGGTLVGKEEDYLSRCRRFRCDLAGSRIGCGEGVINAGGM